MSETPQMRALSPWAEPISAAVSGLSPRLDTLYGKTIGMFATFKAVAVGILDELAKQMKQQYPDTEFVFLQSVYETCEIVNNPPFEAEVRKWLEGVDAVVTAVGDFSSCAMFMAYDAAWFEKMGKPTVMLARPDLFSAARRGARSRMVPGVRCVECRVSVPGFPSMTPDIVERFVAPHIPGIMEKVTEGLTSPLSEEEEYPPAMDVSAASCEIIGTAREIRMEFYRRGWTDGAPIEIPTREAVDEMLRGTDLPADYVVATLPPMNGKATVEKIAINALMAGCLPTHMPVLIAAVRGMVNPCIKLEGWTCSMSCWGPVIAVSGPAAEQINLNSGGNYMSPYYLANAAIAKAFAYIVMNISGVRPQQEDMSELGHENRFGLCLADNSRHNPWLPLHCDYGFAETDSVVTLFWPHEHLALKGRDAAGLLDSMSSVSCDGWDAGALYILSPKAAQVLSDAGWSRQRIKNYIVEYDRRPASEVPIPWIVNNSHVPTNVELPLTGNKSTRVFWSDEHLEILVGGSEFGVRCAVLTGGGDHGGPSHTKIDLPENWDELVKQYGICPKYTQY